MPAKKKVIRSHLFNILFVAWSFCLALCFLPLLVLPRRLAQLGAKVWTGGTNFLLNSLIGLTYEVRGIEKLPDRRVIIASKHQSAWETYIYHGLCRDPIYVLKRSLLFIPVVGWLMGKSGSIAVDRSKGAGALRAMVRGVEKRLNEGGQIVIFPEGTRTPPGQQPPLQPGIAMLYNQFKDVPVIPVALNSGVFWARRSIVKRPGTIVIEFLDPMPTGLSKKDFLAELHKRINEATTRLEKEAAAQS